MRPLPPYLLPGLLMLAALAFGARDTLSVVGVMVEFQEDVLGDNTTGKGTFNSDEAGYALDNRPHDRDYFEKQLEFARNYFLFASDSALYIRYAVFDARQGLYSHVTLDSKMKHYRVPQKRDRESYDEFNLRLNQGIMALAGDALRKARDAGALDSGFVIPGSSLAVDRRTLFLIFHAGASQLTDGGLLGSLGANTPSDLVDSYIAPEDFRDFNGMSYDDDESVTMLHYDNTGGRYGVFSGDSSNFVDKLMICSETMSQDELNWGIHGIIVNQICRAMGLPDLWDTDDGVTAVGGFCLMDVAGYNTFRGFIPVLPSAWCRVKLGWVDPVIAEPDSGFRSVYTLYSTHAAKDPASRRKEIIKVPLSSTEYYLIENRQFLPFAESLLTVRTDNAADSIRSYNVYDTLNGPFVEMLLDSLCPDTACSALRFNGARARGRVLRANSYDVGLPGFGVLIWHVDEKVIRDKIGINMVNANMDRRGVDLEEADGIEDIGVALSNLIQTIYLYGGPEDFFPHKDYHAGAFVNAITPYEQSNRFFGTQTNTGGYTGVTVAVDTFAGKAREHRYLNTAAFELGKEWTVGDFTADSFKVTVSWALSQGRWPKTVPGAAGLSHPADIGGNLYVVSDSGFIHAYHHDGTLLFTDSALSGAGWRFLSSPSVLDSYLVFTGHRAGTDTVAVHRYHPASKQDSLLARFAGDSLSTLISIVRDTLVFGTAKGKIHRTAAGSDTAVTLSPGVPVQSLACDSLRIWAVCGKEIYKVSRANLRPAAVRTVPGMAGSRMKMSAGDVWPDRPGLEVAVCDDAGNAALLDSSLNLLPGWPVKIDNGTAKPPSLGDVDGDGLLDVVIPGNNKVYALNYTGTHLSNWPHVAARRESIGQFIADASLYDIDGNNDMEVFVPAPNGNILILDEDGMYYEFTAGAKVLSRALPFGGLSGPSCVVRNIDTDYSAASNVPEHVEIYTLSAEGVLACFNIPLKGAYKAGWEAEGGSLQRTYVYSGARPRYQEASGDVSIDTLFSYPNPARVNDVTIKYKLSRGAKSVRLRMYNPAGDLIMDKKGLPAFALWNHYPLSLRKTAPGMYSLKLEADGPGGKAFKFTKVGVIK